MDDLIHNIESLRVNKHDFIIVTVGNQTNKEEAFSILKNIKNLKLENKIIITTPNIKLSTLSPEKLKEIGLKVI